MRTLSLLIALCVAALAVRADAVIAGPSASRLPPTMIWAWERPEDLRFIDPARVGVAYLARTIDLLPSGPRVRPRLQPLQVPAGTSLVTVVRLEIGAGPISDAGATTKAIVDAVRPDAKALQIDFDARESDRAFYRDLLTRVRHLLPSSQQLSITALASWCMGDRWIDGLPIDEAVPMLFRMGPDAPSIRRALDRSADFPAPVCRQSAGISTDEPGVRVPAGRRLYVFHPRSWTSHDVTEIRK